MNAKRLASIALVVTLLPLAVGARGFGGGGMRGGFGGMRGGFDFHNDGGAFHPPEGGTHSSTGPYGTNRTTTYHDTSNGYNRTTTASNGDYSRTSSGGYNSSNGNFYHSASASGPYESTSHSTNGNVNSGNYNHSGSGSGDYGSYSNSGSGNYYNHTYSGSGTATNAWGQTYHTNTYYNNGYGYHGATYNNPVYCCATWGWNAGYAWYPAPYYWGGGFWGAFAVGAVAGAAWGSITTPTNVTYTSYQAQPSSPGAKLLESYKLTQTPCGPPNLVVIYGPNKSVICAKPNSTVAAGNYSVNESTLSIVSEAPAGSPKPTS
jgi:hypothetical protein